tara:strand:+ start:42 stop:1244 length:1203 start_codon:yes stop_codon:yes gene_type:complete
MGQCMYKGQPIAGNKQTCNPNVHPGVSWVENDTAPDNSAGFIKAVKQFDGTSKSTEDLQDYFSKRFEEDPAKLAFDAATWLVPGGFAVKGIMGAGKIAKILQKTYKKPTAAVPGTAASARFGGTGTFTKPTGVPINPKTGLPMPTTTKVPTYPINAPNAGRTLVTPRGNTFARPNKAPINRTAATAGTPAGTAFSTGRALTSAGVLGAGAYGVDRNLYPMTEAAKRMEQERATASMQPSIDTIDAKALVDQQTKEAEELSIQKQNEMDNMSFFDKFKLGMKDPATAALFGAGLRDIGGNQVGASELGEMQTDLASAAASGSGPSASLFNATKLSEGALMTRFTDNKPFFSIGDSEAKREKKATYMTGLYRSLQAELLQKGLPSDDRTVMALLEEKFGTKA